MKKLIYFLGLMILFSCSKPLEEPKNLISEERMAEIIAEFAVNDQLSYVITTGNMETSTRFTLKKYGTNGDTFSQSYKYYLVNNQMDRILKKAQNIIRDKDPEASYYIDKKLDQQEQERKKTLGNTSHK